jgi:hypothetical protein
MSKRSIKQGFASSRHLRVLGTWVVVVIVLVSLALAGSASAVAPAPGWEVGSRAYPTNLKPGGTGMVVVQVYNTGAGSTTGDVTVTDALPPGLEATEAGALEPFGSISNGTAEFYEEEDEREEKEEKEGKVTAGEEQLRVWNCSGATVVTCKTGPGAGGIQRPIKAGYAGRIGIAVKVVGEPGTAANRVSVSGGGAPSVAETSNSIAISSATLGFGLTGFDGWFSNADGTPDTQAGSHPYELSLGFGVNTGKNRPAGGDLRDIAIALPPGVIGDPHAVPQCTRQQFLSAITGGCPPDTQVGVDRAGVESEGETGYGDFQLRFAVYNLVPPPGIPAEFGFTAAGSNILIDAGVRSGSDYGITGTVHNLAYQPVFNIITFWGVPDDASHNPERCGIVDVTFAVSCGFTPRGAKPKPLLTVPTSCEGPLTTGLSADSWNAGASPAKDSFVFHDPTGAPVGFSGCEHLSFNPSLSVAPDTSFADTPAGLMVDLRVPQEGLTNVGSVATSNIKNTTVTLPEGVVINPGQAAGLTACGPNEDGLTTEAEKAEGGEDDGPAKCPNTSRVGTDEIETPLLSKPLKGSVYVLQSNPPNLKLLVTASGEGVYLKLVGDVHLDEATGRLTTTFEKTPELPFTDFTLSFSGGAQAALATPTGCGMFSTSSDFTPWSSPFVQDVSPTSAFVIDHGTGDGACPSSPLPFTPSLIAGSTTDQAGGFTNFSLLLTRPDDQQRISSLRFVAPQGLSGMLSKVPLCTNTQAEANTCPEASKIGHTVVESGPGPYPLVVPEPGQSPAPIYLTESYGGAPFGLSIVVPLHVGPFVLPTQRVRAKIEVDPNTSQLTVTTDPLPQVVAGVPTDLRAVNAVIEHPGFMINPTNCDPQSFSGTAYGAPPPGAGGPSASAVIGSHFQVGACQALKFTPKFAVSTSGKTSKANGASLNVKLSFPNLPQGSESNIRTVKVELPKQLPSRLTTLQKACTEQQFNTNPAGCPAASVIGHATAVTPILPVPLTGPAYFVSHGGAKFPELIMVLQGYGVTIDLHGETFISKAGITSSTFHAVPDQPVSSFELNLPQGPYSALTANGNLCTSKLVLPTEFIGQNGALVNQTNHITVTGCAKTKALTRTQKLALALKACHKKAKGAKRTSCERAARKKYGAIRKAKKK